MATYTVEVSDTEDKALAYIAVNPQEWIENLVKARAAAGIQEIYDLEVARMTADPTITSIPADKNAVVLAANVQSAAERTAAVLASMPNPA